MADLVAISQALQNGSTPKVKKLVQAAVEEGVPAEQILTEGLISGMSEIGELFKNNEVYVPEVLISARAMYAGLDILRPLLSEEGVEPLGTVAVGTVTGDLHDIGKNLVAMMLEGAGFKVINLGVDVKPEQFVDAVANQGAQVLALSALLTTTMPAMAQVLDALKAAGLRDKCKVMVGGAPVTQGYADEIGADGYAADAASAATLAKELIKQL